MANPPKQELPIDVVLDPDNPLLEKFQKALKDHLLRQIVNLKNEIFELDCGTKKSNAKREELGVFAYEIQQNINKQQGTLESNIKRLEEVQASREEINLQLKEKREAFKIAKQELAVEENKDIKMRNEIEAMNLLIKQISAWEQNLESDITTKKRVFEKSRKDKQKLIAEKRQQDALIYRQMTRIWDLEHELEKMDLQIKGKEEEREDMAQHVALGNTNIEAIQAETKALMHSWNSVVVAIGNRDRILSCLSAEMIKVEEDFKSVHSEIEQMKKLTQNEQRKNEMLTVIKSRFVSDNQKCKQMFDSELQKKSKLERRMLEMTGIIEQTNHDVARIEEELHDAKQLMESYNHEFEQLYELKTEMEVKIVSALEDQVTNTKILSRLRKTLNGLKTRNKDVETQIAMMENRISTISRDNDTIKAQNKESDKYLHELELQNKELEHEADKYQDEIKKMEIKINQRQREMDYLAVKYQKTLEKTMTTDESSSPLELKISALERGMEEIQEQNKKMQQFWLREQTNLLTISQGRQDQIQNNNIVRKQIMIMEQKNLKLSDELERQKRIDHKLTRSIINLGSRLAMLSDSVSKTKDMGQVKGKESDMMRQDYIYKLKDAELECLHLEDEIEEIEADKIQLSRDLIDLNRDALEWEKKLICARETKTTMTREHSQDGELGVMKAEIHRMNVRYAQLRKVQEVLIHDLEHCVARRDAILMTTEARQKRTKGAMEKTRVNFTRKMDDLRNRIKYNQMQIEKGEENLKAMDQEKDKIELALEEVKKSLEHTEEQQVYLQEEIELAITAKLLHFECLIQMQKKLHIYTCLIKGERPSLTFRSDSTISMEYDKEKEINDRLAKVIEMLKNGFPKFKHEFIRCINTLKIPIFITMPN